MLLGWLFYSSDSCYVIKITPDFTGNCGIGRFEDVIFYTNTTCHILGLLFCVGFSFEVFGPKAAHQHIIA